jgi:hypothetical protein
MEKILPLGGFFWFGAVVHVKFVVKLWWIV